MRLLALLAVRDEIRYVDSVLAHLVEQGAEVCVIDHGSTDGTREVVERWLGHGVARLEDQPWTGAFELVTQLQIKERLAAEEEADWYLHLDADERRLAPPPYPTLVDGLADADARGFDAVDFDEFVFVPTAEDPSFEGRDFAREMRWYYHYEPTTGDRWRINAWKRREGIDLVSTGGHHVRFAGQRVFPRPFVMRHYPVLSAAHARAKYGSRVFAPDELARQWHGDRAAFRADRELVWPPRAALHEVGPDDAPDPTAPWDRHPFLDPLAGPRPQPVERDHHERGLRREALREHTRRHRAHVGEIPPVAGGGQRPRWSVMLPVREPRRAHLAEALRSVLDQDPGRDHMEIVVLDDASSFDVAALVADVAGDRVGSVRHDRALGLAGNWNAAVRASRGELVHLLHQDDRVQPGFYDRLGRPLGDRSDLVGSWCRVAGFDDDGRLTWTPAPERIDPGVVDDLALKEAEQHRMLIPGVVVRRSVYEEIGGYRDDLPYCTDWDFVKRLTALGPTWYEPLVLAPRRQHDHQETKRLQATGADLADRRRSIELTADLLSADQRSRATSAALRGSVVLAIERLRELVQADATDAAVAQAREVLATLELGRHDGTVPDATGRVAASEAAPPRLSDRSVAGVGAPDRAAVDRAAADRRRIADLEAQLKGWVEAVRVARSQPRGG
jgi:glycosyltransferase involved in cell wall biosynthesis